MQNPLTAYLSEFAGLPTGLIKEAFDSTDTFQNFMEHVGEKITTQRVKDRILSLISNPEAAKDYETLRARMDRAQSVSAPIKRGRSVTKRASTKHPRNAPAS